MNRKTYHQNYYLRNREKILAQAKANRERNPNAKNDWLKRNGHKPKVRFDKAKSNRKRKGWYLSFEEYAKIIANPCFYCGADNSQSKGSGLDRLDNSKGYEISNVVSCCYACNAGRNNNFTPEEWKVGITAILAFRNRI